MFLRTRHLPLRVTPPKIATILSGTRLCPAVSMVKRLAAWGATGVAGADEDKIARDRNEVVEGLGRHQLVDAVVVLLQGQPALGVRGAEQGRHLFAVGVGGTQVATGNGADIRRFGEGLDHAPKLVRSPRSGDGPLGLSGRPRVTSGRSLITNSDDPTQVLTR